MPKHDRLSEGSPPLPASSPSSGAPSRHAFAITHALYYLISWTWGILQTLAGFAVWCWLKFRQPANRRFVYHGAQVTTWESPYSLSLGMFIFLGQTGRAGEERLLCHEFGHTIQSCMLGPAYVLVIGLPSLLWARLGWCKRLRARERMSYYQFYTERWADVEGMKVLHKQGELRHNA